MWDVDHRSHTDWTEFFHVIQRATEGLGHRTQRVRDAMLVPNSRDGKEVIQLAEKLGKPTVGGEQLYNLYSYKILYIDYIDNIYIVVCLDIRYLKKRCASTAAAHSWL